MLEAILFMFYHRKGYHKLPCRVPIYRKGYHCHRKGYHSHRKGYHKLPCRVPMHRKGYQINRKGYQIYRAGYHIKEKITQNQMKISQTRHQATLHLPTAHQNQVTITAEDIEEERYNENKSSKYRKNKEGVDRLMIKLSKLNTIRVNLTNITLIN